LFSLALRALPQTKTIDLFLATISYSDETMDAPTRSEESQDAGDASYEDEAAEEEEAEEDEEEDTSQADDGGAQEEEEDAEEDDDAPTVYSSVATLQSLSHLRDISDTAVSWLVSSAKPGNGVEQLRDPATDTYWQSDGTSQPHYIQIHFHRRLAVTHVALYLDYGLDESYTPKTIKIETGMTSQDLTCGNPAVNACMELNEPTGWVILPVHAPLDPLAVMGNNNSSTGTSHHNHKAHLIRISILSMHQNGRDTHVRRLALFAEPQPATVRPAAMAGGAVRYSQKHNNKRSKMDTTDDQHDEDDDDLSYNTRGLTSGFATLGMGSPFATTIR